jgi:hypothetical protein
MPWSSKRTPVEIFQGSVVPREHRDFRFKVTVTDWNARVFQQRLVVRTDEYNAQASINLVRKEFWERYKDLGCYIFVNRL